MFHAPAHKSSTAGQAVAMTHEEAKKIVYGNEPTSEKLLQEARAVLAARNAFSRSWGGGQHLIDTSYPSQRRKD